MKIILMILTYWIVLVLLDKILDYKENKNN